MVNFAKHYTTPLPKLLLDVIMAVFPGTGEPTHGETLRTSHYVYKYGKNYISTLHWSLKTISWCLAELDAFRCP
jgi:hypothetical protein